MESAYLVRYGLMRHLGLFSADSEDFERGQTVVVRSYRGLELGEVLLKRPEAPTAPTATRVLRVATAEDLEQARRRALLDRPGRLAVCERVLREGSWPLDLLDVEPLLEGRRTVLHFLGPHDFDAAGLRSTFWDACDLDVIFESAGVDTTEIPEPADDQDHGCGHCGSGGGCGSGSDAGSGSCSGCSVKSLMGRRKAATASC